MKSYRVFLTPRAERQLAELYAYIADHSSRTRAENFTSAMIADCMALANFPHRGTKRDDIRPNLRIKGYARRVTIAFSVDDDADTVAIHGIFYGGQNFEPMLRVSPADE